MREWKDEGVIIRLGYFREADIRLKLLFKTHGLQTVFAFGAVKSKRRFCGCLDTLNSLACRVRQSRDGRFLTLEEASLLQSPRNLRVNWQNMGITTNCLRFVEALPINSDMSVECFAIISNLRDYMEQGGPLARLVPQFFRLRIATAAGFAPNFDNCGACGQDVAMDGYFMANEGRYFCEDCSARLPYADKRYAIKISAKSLELLRSSRFKLPACNETHDLRSSELRQCCAVIDGFVQYHLGLVWNNGYFKQI